MPTFIFISELSSTSIFEWLIAIISAKIIFIIIIATIAITVAIIALHYQTKNLQ